MEREPYEIANLITDAPDSKRGWAIPPLPSAGLGVFRFAASAILGGILYDLVKLLVGF